MRAGLHFRKVDLHTHTPASDCFLDKTVTPDGFVRAAIGAGLDVVAVTDHNSGSWVDLVKAAAARTGLTVFPGVEITVQGGVHIIALFDVDKGTEHVRYLLGGLGISPEKQGKQDALCKKSAFDVVREITERGGLAILAHIDKPKGAWVSLTGQTRLQLFNQAPYSAVETSDGNLLPQFRQIKELRRKPATYQASDNPDTANPGRHSLKGIGSQFAYFKLDDTITLESMRQCFSDPPVRIRSSSWPNSSAYPRIVSLAVTGGFLEKQRVEFNQGLNTIIGGKGAGKSLIVEFLRFALDQASTEESISDDHITKLDKCLGLSCAVELVLETVHGTRYLVRRVPRGEFTCVEQETGDRYEGSVRELFPLLAYSQSEIISIARNPLAQLELTDRFFHKPPYLSAIASLQKQLTENDAALAEAMAAQDELAECNGDIATLPASARYRQAPEAKTTHAFRQF